MCLLTRHWILRGLSPHSMSMQHLIAALNRNNPPKTLSQNNYAKDVREYNLIHHSTKVNLEV